jgi:hypothetical protein
MISKSYPNERLDSNYTTALHVDTQHLTSISVALFFENKKCHVSATKIIGIYVNFSDSCKKNKSLQFQKLQALSAFSTL